MLAQQTLSKIICSRNSTALRDTNLVPQPWQHSLWAQRERKEINKNKEINIELDICFMCKEWIFCGLGKWAFPYVNNISSEHVPTMPKLGSRNSRNNEKLSVPETISASRSWLQQQGFQWILIIRLRRAARMTKWWRQNACKRARRDTKLPTFCRKLSRNNFVFPRSRLHCFDKIVAAGKLPSSPPKQW